MKIVRYLVWPIAAITLAWRHWTRKVDVFENDGWEKIRRGHYQKELPSSAKCDIIKILGMWRVYRYGCYTCCCITKNRALSMADVMDR